MLKRIYKSQAAPCTPVQCFVISFMLHATGGIAVATASHHMCQNSKPVITAAGAQMLAISQSLLLPCLF